MHRLCPRKFYAVLFAALALPACSALGGKTLSAQQAAQEPYRLRTGDEIEITVGGRSDSATKVPIGEDGTALYPPIGDLPAAGRSIRELEIAIEEKLRSQILPEGASTAPEPSSPVEALSPAEAFNAAYLLHRDHEIGSIRVGKHADFAVLADNPLTVDPRTIKDIPVQATILGGRVFAAG